MVETPQAIKPGYILQAVLKRRWFLIIPFCISILAGIYFAITLPKIYQSETLILVEAQRVPTNYVQSVVSTDIDARISTISQQIMSRTNMEKILNDFKLFSGPKYENMYLEDKIESLRRRIAVTITKDRRRSADAFSISFKGEEPERVMQVVNALAAYFINENLKVREAQAIGTSDFLEDELENMRKRLEQTEETLKVYRKQHMGELPEQLETNLRILDRLQEQLGERQGSLRMAKTRRDDLATRIQEMNRANASNSGELVGSGQMSTPKDLDQMNKQLEELLARYTEKHPDVISLKKSINEKTENLKNQPAVKGKTGSKKTGKSAALDPSIVRTKNELIGEIKNLSQEIVDIKKEIAFYQKRVENTPRREQELMSLRRDYSDMQESYSSLLSRKLESEIAVNMERKQKGEQFRIIDSARLPEKPIEPDMRRLFMLFVMAGLGIGGAIIFLFEYFDSSLKTPDDIETDLGLQVLGTIPPLLDAKQKRLSFANSFLSTIFVLFSVSLLGVFAFLTFKGVDQALFYIKKVIVI